MKITADPQIKVDAAAAVLQSARGKMELTKRQLLIGLATMQFITDAEAVAWSVSGTLPAAIEAMVLAMPAAQQTATRITLASFTVAYRLDPMVAMLAAVAPVALSETDLDDFFNAFAAV